MALVLALAFAAQAAEPIRWDEAGHHVGEEVVVEGRILGVHCSPLSCLFAFDPTFNRFTAVIQAARFADFPSPQELDQRYSGRLVRVRGTIREIDGKPEVVLQRPTDITLNEPAPSKEDLARDNQRAVDAQVEAVERMTEVLERLEELIARMADTQDRMDVVLGRLEERTVELAAAQASAAPPPLVYEAPPRPGYERLRSLKRGMTPDEVQRLVGPPRFVENAANGGMTWHYDSGRSISFNARGRAEGLIGFQR
jgi:uncharacterized coiled-coil protein SlyX